MRAIMLRIGAESVFYNLTLRHVSAHCLCKTPSQTLFTMRLIQFAFEVKLVWLKSIVQIGQKNVLTSGASTFYIACYDWSVLWLVDKYCKNVLADGSVFTEAYKKVQIFTLLISWRNPGGTTAWYTFIDENCRPNVYIRVRRVGIYIYGR